VSTSGVVTLLTDFGPGSVYVGQMHGVVLSRDPAVRVVDLAHDVPPGGVAAGAYVLHRSFVHFPAGTVHVAVIDPGVGSARKIVAARAHGHLFLAPDNGLLGSVLADADDAEVRSVENSDLMNTPVSRTFHGRDVFAPVAAHLAGGGELARVGPPTTAAGAPPGPVVGLRSVEGAILLVDRFGNLITNIPRAQLQALGEPSRLRVRVGPVSIDGLMQTFSDVAGGAALIYVGSGEHLEIAVNGGRASELLALRAGAAVRVERRD